MPPLTGPPLPGQASSRGNVMIVDDNPANLKLLEDMLRQHEYEVRSFPRGRLALAAAEQEPPDLILLDINMPEMNGYEVCERLKSNPALSGIPVIFLSALNAVDDKIKGFHSGGIDYISKPFQFEEVRARVETQVQLQRARQREHDLLERTLGGAVGTLWELVQITSPELALRSSAIRDIVRCIVKGTGIGDLWQHELAATLCLVGCLALPEDVFQRAYGGKALSSDEERMFQAHPETAARLLSRIPRLEIVARIIRGQQGHGTEPSATEQSAQGSRMLRLALELDQRIYRGATRAAALAELRLSRRFDRLMLDALETYTPVAVEFDVKQVSIGELRTGMILTKNVMSRDGSLMILKQGTILTETWLQRLENFARSRGAQALVDVRIPKVEGAGPPEEFRRG